MSLVVALRWWSPDLSFFFSIGRPFRLSFKVALLSGTPVSPLCRGRAKSAVTCANPKYASYTVNRFIILLLRTSDDDAAREKNLRERMRKSNKLNFWRVGGAPQRRFGGRSAVRRGEGATGAAAAPAAPPLTCCRRRRRRRRAGRGDLGSPGARAKPGRCETPPSVGRRHGRGPIGQAQRRSAKSVRP